MMKMVTMNEKKFFEIFPNRFLMTVFNCSIFLRLFQYWPSLSEDHKSEIGTIGEKFKIISSFYSFVKSYDRAPNLSFKRW